jgi:hypothetical protein
LIRRTGDQSSVELLDAVTRMSQPIRQLAIVRQDHQPCAFLVESTDRIDTLRNLREEIDNARSSCWIDVRRNIAFGLVDRVIDHRLDANRFAIHCDSSFIRVDSRTELADDLPVDGNSTLLDQDFTATPRANSGMG